jgi:hypothetical protein
MDERIAVDLNSGKSVPKSDPVPRRLTNPATGGRKPSARPPIPRYKTWQGAGQGPAIEIEREALDTPSPSADREAVALSDFEASQIIDFFRQLDRWDQEGPHASKTM